MLNISHNQLNKKMKLENYSAFSRVFRPNHFNIFNKFLVAFAIVGMVILFLPWTQNVTGNGYVTTLTPRQRPQTIQSPIPGKIEKWFVREGDFVKKGDTILRISEVKTEYQDPKLIERTEQQVDAKNGSAVSYQAKIASLDNQAAALIRERNLKLDQTKNKIEQVKFKVVSDSTNLIAIRNNYTIAEVQYNRTAQLEKEGLKAKADVEQKLLKRQEMQAKQIAQENKLLISKNQLVNAKVEINRIKASYQDKIAKSRSNRATAASAKFEALAQVAKLENQSSNYQLRKEMYYITAPQSGHINHVLRSGLGETFKEGEKLVGIMPSFYQVAVETYVDPIDLPLIHKGEKVGIQFDGWPAIFFSGWPNASHGTFVGKVIAIENVISKNGKFRVLIAPDPIYNEWPKNIRVGSGAYTIALLEDVPIWYELWRQLNGFPPNYYTPKKDVIKK